MSPKQEILEQVRNALDLLEQSQFGFIRYDRNNSLFRASDDLQAQGILQRLINTAIGEGISEQEA